MFNKVMFTALGLTAAHGADRHSLRLSVLEERRDPKTFGRRGRRDGNGCRRESSRRGNFADCAAGDGFGRRRG